MWAGLIRKLAAAGARVIAFDILFTEPDRMNASSLSRSLPGIDDAMRRQLKALPGNDAAMAAAMAAAKGRAPVILGFAGTTDPPLTGTPPLPIPPTDLAVLAGANGHLPRLMGVLAPIPELGRAAAGLGALSLVAEVDGTRRRVPMVFAYKDQAYPSLAMEILRHAFDTPKVGAAADGTERIAVPGDGALPTDAHGRVWVYYAPRGSTNHISARAVLADAVDPARLRGKIVIVGTTAAVLGDRHATPVDPVMPGVDIHAQAVTCVITGTCLRRPTYIGGVELVLVFVAGLLLIAVWPLVGTVWTLPLTLSVVAVVGGLSWTLFSTALLLLDASFTVLALMFVYGAMAFGRMIRSESPGK